MSSLLNDTVKAATAAVADNQFTFNSTDYTVFALVLSISAAIGVYFGFFNKGEDTTDEYLMGGKRMKTIPIAISLVASQLSAISIMTIPAEMYSYGINWIFNVICMIVVVPILNYVIIPVFYNNNLTSCYEYLEIRFNKPIRELQTIMFTGTLFFMLPIFIFLPSLAFSQVTGYNVHIINTIVCGICVFYTMVGGIKAVVWTDVVQAGIMVISVVLVGVMGANRVGGLGEVIRIAGQGGRLEVNYNFDATTRSTFWNIFTSATLMWSGYVGLNQSCVQRIVSLPTLGHARRSLVIFGFGFMLIMSFNCFTGIVMFTRYHDCDPLKLGLVSKGDKMVPHFVQDVVGHLRGMPGVFISCVFSAALSTLSASINSLGGVVYFDYIKPHIRHTEHKANVIMKIFVFCCGVYCIFGGMVVEKFGSILQVIYSIGGCSFGSTCATFLLGMLVPRAHGRAVFIAAVSSIICMTAIIGAAWGRNHYAFLPTSIDNCSAFNTTTTTTTTTTTPLPFSFTTINDHLPDEKKAFSILDLSFNWYTSIGFLLTWLIALPLSYTMKPAPDANFDPKLLSPIVQPFINYELTPSEELNELKSPKEIDKQKVNV
ncbi:sodium-coupled monocarboxylate transporter 2-like [Drosophila tropicalis]|uniref:sodium-coupled monocarboxylate transporter 2-like n=1 Tax=Drosophila tropicalis TaxID=46794 RepID=UPI0035AC03F3